MATSVSQQPVPFIIFPDTLLAEMLFHKVSQSAPERSRRIMSWIRRRSSSDSKDKGKSAAAAPVSENKKGKGIDRSIGSSSTVSSTPSTRSPSVRSSTSTEYYAEKRPEANPLQGEAGPSSYTATNSDAKPDDLELLPFLSMFSFNQASDEDDHVTESTNEQKDNKGKLPAPSKQQTPIPQQQTPVFPEKGSSSDSGASNSSSGKDSELEGQYVLRFQRRDPAAKAIKSKAKLSTIRAAEDGTWLGPEGGRDTPEDENYSYRLVFSRRKS